MANIFIKTYGCSLNMADSEAIAGILEDNGHLMVDDEDAADIMLVNSCTVKGPTENSILRYLDKIMLKKKVILIGCIPAATPGLVKDISLVGTNHFNDIVEAVQLTLDGKIVRYLDEKSRTRSSNLPKKRKKKMIAIIPISSGCLGNCNYCIVKYARGRLVSYPPKEIIAEAKKAVKEGAKEIWLTSQDCGCYGFDNGRKYLLPDLVRDICKIKGDFHVRIGMANPNHVIEIIEPLLKSYADDKVYKFMHIPVQSGSDKVLKEMGRRYEVKDFLKIVEQFRKRYKMSSISTDMIIGYPTETEEDFSMSLKLVEKIKPDTLNISRFWPRPRTESANLKQLPGGVVKDRSRVMTKIFNKNAAINNSRWIRWEGDILIDEKGKDDSMIGRNDAYKVFVVRKKGVKIEDKLHVKVVKSDKYSLYSKISC